MNAAGAAMAANAIRRAGVADADQLTALSARTYTETIGHL